MSVAGRKYKSIGGAVSESNGKKLRPSLAA